MPRNGKSAVGRISSITPRAESEGMVVQDERRAAAQIMAANLKFQTSSMDF